MNYELAKQLKDAGFPQTGKSERGDWYFLDKLGEWKQYWTNLDDYPKGIYSPMLEELIEACGESFRRLEVTLLPSIKWHVVGVNIPGSLDIFSEVHGSTPTEAVANLWLALHKVQ